MVTRMTAIWWQLVTAVLVWHLCQHTFDYRIGVAVVAGYSLPRLSKYILTVS